MAKTPAQRGPFGNWLKRVREERYRTQAEALAAMRRLAGIAISESEYSQWEAGSRTPRQDNPKVARLYEFFGSQPDLDAPETPAGDIVALVAELREQNRHMAALLTELREYRLMTGDALRAQHATQTGIEEAILALGTAMGATIPLGRERPEQRPGGQGSEGRARGAAI